MDGSKPDTKQQNRNPRKWRGIRRAAIFIVVAVLLLLAGVHLFSLITEDDALRGTLRVPENGVTTVLTPLQTGFSGVVNAVVDYLRSLKYRANIEAAYNDARLEIERLTYLSMRVEELERELAVYQELYGEISVNESMNPLVARVISRSDGNYFSVFTINKGTKDGVKDFMAVTMDGALVGYTYNTQPFSASVRSIIDSGASIAGLISSSRDQGTVRGTLGVDGTAMCRMYYLPEEHLPRPGDDVVTSGVGLGFPKGIPIGTVRESTRGMESNKSFVVVEPLADFEHIEEVIVLRYQPDAEEVVSQNTTQSLDLVPMETVRPIPTIQIGSDFFQLAPTPEPTGDLPQQTTAPDGTVITVTPAPTSQGSEIVYNVPNATEDPNPFGYTLPPTASPTPTVPPLELTVEDDAN
ncbi:MAG TPA: rod shape-determining protein MreC [Candidatus Limiplasma sp.]|nr:rod shape-determining protein MreC [Candidatus Limiplasma sp.]HRX09056.1 rod shape-determining protein MreC [Candidatus Limiplasma sp.]